MEAEQVEETLQNHLRRYGLLTNESTNWTIRKSSLGGRGMFARRDIKCDEAIYVDVALVIAPRNCEMHLPLCVTCYKNNCPLFPCDRGCGLPVCSQQCEDSTIHGEKECRYLREHLPICGSTWSMTLLRALVAVRGILMDQKQQEVFAALQHHHNPRRSSEVELLKKSIERCPSVEELDFMRRVCEAFDTNSYETIVVHDENRSASLRGLYPLGGLQNHSCVPNTRHHFDSNQRLHVFATRPISAGEELTMTYVDLLWDTTLRRQALSATKYFACVCERCSDPTERGSFLSALFCAMENCSGILLSKEPLNNESIWICNRCPITLKARQMRSIRSGLATIVQENATKSPRELLEFLQKELPIFIPSSNYITIEIKYRVISYFGRTEGLAWRDLTDNELVLKSSYCNDLLAILSVMGCGDCKKKGLLLYEKYCTDKERLRRLDENLSAKNDESVLLSEKINKEENEILLKEARSIFMDDVTVNTLMESDLRD